MEIANLVDKKSIIRPISSDIREIIEHLATNCYALVTGIKKNEILIVTAQDVINHQHEKNISDYNLQKPIIQLEVSIFSAVKKMIETNQYFLPVYDKKKFIGVLSLIDIAGRFADNITSIKRNQRFVLHDVRNPLSNIKGLTKMLLGDCKTDQTFLLENILTASDRAYAVINDLAVQGTQKIDTERTEMNSFFKECLADQTGIAINRNISLSVKFNDKQIMRHINRNQVKRAIQNIISNAIQYSSKDTLINVSSRFDGKSIRLSVTNVGKEIDPIYLNRLGNKKNEYLNIAIEDNTPGYGLEIAKDFIESNNGTLICKSINQVTTFDIIF